MIILIKLLGLLITGVGLGIFASPGFSAKLFDFFKSGKNIYYAGVFRGLAGLLILVTASRSTVPLAAIALGIMFLVSGITIFAAEREKLLVFVEHYSQMPGLVIRLLGLVAASFGILVLSIY